MRRCISIILICISILTNSSILEVRGSTFDTQSVEKIQQAQQFNNIIIFVDFADSVDNFLTHERRNIIIDMYNGTSIKSLSNYISAISNDKMKINNYFSQDNNGSIIPYRLSKPRSYYNKSTEYEMVKEVISNVKIDETISLDGNNDGEVDNVTFIFAGGSTGTADVFWPHKHNHQNGSKINGKGVNAYNLHNEKSIFEDNFSGGRGVIAHEFLHTLGMPDLYHSSGNSVPVGRWDIMGNVHSSFLQYPLAYLRKDWVNIEHVKASGTYTLDLATAKEGKNAIIIKTPLSEKEFFVLEYRKAGNPYKDELEARIPGTGLIVYRVNTEVDTNFTGQKDYVYVFRPGESGEVDGLGDLSKSFLSQESGRTSYGTADMNANISQGAITYSSGINSGIVIKNVSSAVGDKITFDIEIPDLTETGIWKLLGDGPVNSIESDQVSMDIFNDEVYITYSEGYSNKKLKSAKFDGSRWTQLGNGLLDGCYDAKIKVYKGIPYIIYHRYDNNGYYRLYISKFYNGVWNTIQSISEDESQYSDIISTNTGLYIAYTDFGTSILKVSKLNDNTGKFEQIGNNIDNGYIYGISICEDEGQVYVSYSDFYESDKIHVKQYLEDSWEKVGHLNITAKYTNVISNEGKVYLAVSGEKIQVYELENSSWVKIGEDIADNKGFEPNIQILDNNTYISYIDLKTGEIKFKLFDGSNWIDDGYRVSDKMSNNLNFIINNGVGYISYLDKNGMVEVRSRVLKEIITEPEYEDEDLNKDGKIDILDVSMVALKYNLTYKDLDWDNNLDTNKDGIIDLFDIVKIAKRINN